MSTYTHLRDILDTLDDLGIDAFKVQHEHHPNWDAPQLAVTLRTRTDMTAFCAAIGLKIEQGAPSREHRTYSAHEGKDIAGTPLLITCTSWPWHEDWEDAV